MEVRNHIIGVVQNHIETSVRENNARHTTNGEQEDETNRPQHRNTEGDRATPHRRNPGEDFHPGRHSNHHRGSGEISACINAQSNGVHMVRPNNEANEPNRNHGVGHSQITKHWLFGEGRDDVADNAKGRQDHDIHLWVSEEPEQVQEQNRVATAFRDEECSAEIAVSQQHGDRTRQNRHCQQKQKRGDQHGPGKKRHLVQRHAGCAHVEDRGDEVGRTKDRGHTGEVQRENRKVHRHTRCTR